MLNENNQHEMFLDRPLTNSVPILPPQLTFNSEKLTSITPYIKEIRYSPNTGLSYNYNQTMKFLLNSTGFIDPYGTYLCFDIENKSNRPLQFDNSAHSLISSIIISTNGNVIEEINDYDVISSIIFDSTFNSDSRKLYSDLCFGSSSHLGGEGTGEPILYDSNTANFNENIAGDNNSNLIKRIWKASIKSLEKPNNIMSGTIVKNGKIMRWEPKTKIRIMLPLMSNILGFGLSLQNYKWIPLEIFPNLEFSIKLNEYALFSPFPINPNLFGTLLDGDMDGERKGRDNNGDNDLKRTQINSFLADDSVKNRRYELSNTQLITTQLFFDSSLLYQIKEMVYKSGFVLETQLMQSFQQKYFRSSPENTYVLNVPRKSIRSVMSIFLNRNYEKHTICRKLKRYSRGIIKLQVKVGEDCYPYNPIEGNSSNNYCVSNNTSFLKSWEKVFYKTNSNYGDSIINKFNYAIDCHWSDMIATAYENNNIIPNLQLGFGYYPSIQDESVGNNEVFETSPYQHGSYMTEIIGRAIFSVSLDQLPMSGNLYKSGVDTRFTKPILIEFTQHQDFTNNYEHVGNNQFIQYVILEYDYTLKVGNNGFIIKDF
jgi:hypothetical protein